jgi:hypothetical protein
VISLSKKNKHHQDVSKKKQEETESSIIAIGEKNHKKSP